MSIDLSSRKAFDQLAAHAGHEIACAVYGGEEAVIECGTCGEILFVATAADIDEPSDGHVEPDMLESLRTILDAVRDDPHGAEREAAEALDRAGDEAGGEWLRAHGYKDGHVEPDWSADEYATPADARDEHDESL